MPTVWNILDLFFGLSDIKHDFPFAVLLQTTFNVFVLTFLAKRSPLLAAYTSVDSEDLCGAGLCKVLVLPVVVVTVPHVGQLYFYCHCRQELVLSCFLSATMDLKKFLPNNFFRSIKASAVNLN